MTLQAPSTEVVKLACLAPSIQNSQPWLWRVRDNVIELYADRRHELAVADPSARGLVISCGAALHHAQVAARALGWRTQVSRLPDPNSPDLMARLTLGPARPTQAATAGLQAILDRCTDRRRFTTWPIPAERLTALVSAAEARGASAVAVTDAADRVQVEVTMNRAIDAQTRAVEPWPDENLTQQDGILVLGGPKDDVPDWLRTGEALSALWLRATVDGLSVVPLSGAIETEETRHALRHGVLGGRLAPHLLVRVGWQAIGRSELARTPRRPIADVLLSTSLAAR